MKRLTLAIEMKAFVAVLLSFTCVLIPVLAVRGGGQKEPPAKIDPMQKAEEIAKSLLKKRIQIGRSKKPEPPFTTYSNGVVRYTDVECVKIPRGDLFCIGDKSSGYGVGCGNSAFSKCERMLAQLDREGNVWYLYEKPLTEVDSEDVKKQKLLAKIDAAGTIEYSNGVIQGPNDKFVRMKCPLRNLANDQKISKPMESSVASMPNGTYKCRWRHGFASRANNTSYDTLVQIFQINGTKECMKEGTRKEEKYSYTREEGENPYESKKITESTVVSKPIDCDTLMDL